MLIVAAMVGGVGAVSAATAISGSPTPGPLFAEDETPTEASNVTTTGEPNGTTNDSPNVTTSDPTTETDGESAGNIAPGARLAGVIGAQQAEHAATVESKTFEKSFDTAASNESKATVVARSSERIQDRLQTLETETETLEAAYRNDTISDDTYQGKMTSLTARIQSLEHLANRTTVKSRTLPPAALEARGLNRSDLTELENRTRNATSPRAADIAAHVVGPRAGQPTGPPKTVPGHAEDGPGNGNGPQSSAERGDGPGQTPGQNESTEGSGPPNATNATSSQPSDDSSSSPGGDTANRSNERANTEHFGQGAGSTDNETRGQNGHQGSPASSNGNDHPVFGNLSAVEIVLGFFG
ncbi:putative component of type IV pili like system [Halanaeroarchaeum sp. HSR-CO]|nr:putative component of type IV pili like system [Halanaeroarchaeum sp. HSR-CO]